MAVVGATTRAVLETYVEHFLTPALRPGQLVAMDNLGAHKPKRVTEVIEDKGCELIYPQPYFPEFNPIEEAFSKVKHILRKIGARGKETLIEAMGRALGTVRTEDVRGFFAHCGYHVPAQQL
jgi:transposase